MCGLLAFELGAEVSDRASVPGAGLATHVYYTLGLFVFGGMDLGVPSGGPVVAQRLLWVAYFLCPAITASAVAEGILRAIDPESWALRRVKKHIVIGGGGRLTRMYLTRLRSRHPDVPVIVVEKRYDKLRPEALQQEFGAHLVLGDITRDAVIDGLRLDAARRLVLLTGNDFDNMEAATRISQRHAHLKDRTIVHVSDITMLRLMEETQVLNGAQVINSHMVSASHLVQTRLLEHFEATRPRDVVAIAGFGRFGQTILKELQEHAGEAFDEVIIIDKKANYQAALFEEQVGFQEGLRVELVEGDMGDPSVWARAQQLVRSEVTEPVFVLGTNDDNNNLRVAMWLSRSYPRAYIVSLSYRQSSFSASIKDVCRFDIVSADDLIMDSMNEGWF